MSVTATARVYVAKSYKPLVCVKYFMSKLMIVPFNSYTNEAFCTYPWICSEMTFKINIRTFFYIVRIETMPQS